MNQHEMLNYVEFPAKDLIATKRFFKEVFAWEFEDYGPEYSAFSNQGLDGGFYKAELKSDSGKGAALMVFFSDDLQSTLEKVLNAGGEIVKEIFEFPGGKRFHFCEPSGNEFAVWAE